MAFTRTPLNSEEEDLIRSVMGESHERGSLVRVTPPGICLSRTNDLERVRTFEVRKDDVYVVTPPKCGTTWMQEIVWHIRTDFDVEGSR